MDELFKQFPIFSLFVIIGFVYVFWYATGGVERGEARREAGDPNLFVQVDGVPTAFDEGEVFGVFGDGSAQVVASSTQE